MYWIEICTDGSYVVDGQEFPLLSEGIEQLESNDGERSGSDWVKYSTLSSSKPSTVFSFGKSSSLNISS
ncbi:hypothetical protein P4114_21345 [Pseudomonas aeruginosa]|nr:hypothetical protein [Pseudomonas aeruginosa]